MEAVISTEKGHRDAWVAWEALRAGRWHAHAGLLGEQAVPTNKRAISALDLAIGTCVA
jgi:hypothetical protein